MSESISAEQFLNYLGAKGTKNKYRVAPKADRTWEGATYASKAEMRFHKYLFADTTVTQVVRQLRIHLGPDVVYVPDFLVYYNDGTHRYVDVKGTETAEFRRKKNLWLKYHPDTPLWIVKAKRRGGWEWTLVEKKKRKARA